MAMSALVCLQKKSLNPIVGVPLSGEAVEDFFDSGVHLGMVVVEEIAVRTIGYDQAYSESVVSHELRESVDGRGLHLKVCETGVFIGKGGQLVVEVLDSRMEAYVSSLRRIESWCCCCDALEHIKGYFLEQRLATSRSIGMGKAVVKTHMLHKCLLEFGIKQGLRTLVVIHQTVHAYCIFPGNETSAGDVALEASTSTDAYKVEGSMLWHRFSFCKVDVGGGVEFGKNDIDVVGTHAGTDGCKAMALICPCKSMDLPIHRLKLDSVEDFFEHVYAGGVANEDYVIGQLFSC